MFPNRTRLIIKLAEALWERSGRRGAVWEYVDDAVREIDGERTEKFPNRAEIESPTPFLP